MSKEELTRILEDIRKIVGEVEGTTVDELKEVADLAYKDANKCDFAGAARALMLFDRIAVRIRSRHWHDTVELFMSAYNEIIDDLWWIFREKCGCKF
jgi:menaquinone-dependent protoporphyrinogen IX oxidase